MKYFVNSTILDLKFEDVECLSNRPSLLHYKVINDLPWMRGIALR